MLPSAARPARLVVVAAVSAALAAVALGPTAPAEADVRSPATGAGPAAVAGAAAVTVGGRTTPSAGSTKDQPTPGEIHRLNAARAAREAKALLEARKAAREARELRAARRATREARTAARDAQASEAARSHAGRTCPVPGASFSDTYGASRGGHGHAGVDMLAPSRTRIRAVESGTVLRAHWSGSMGGWTITLRGVSGSLYFHAHNAKNLVRSGQPVKVGQVIALVGSTGNAGTVNHLHFEYWKSGRESDPVNPTPLISSLC